MTYLEFWPDLLKGKDEVFYLAREGKVRNVTLINITVLGIVFGLSNLLVALKISPDLPLQGKFALITPALFSVIGIVYMFVALAGFCLIYWAAAKAFGGPGGLWLVMDLIGLSAVPFWILAPMLNYYKNLRSSEPISLVVLLPIVLAFAWSFKLIRQSMVAGQGISEGKATLAVACMWIFSISSVYVFLP